MQRTPNRPRRPLGVQCLRLFAGQRIHADNRVERWTLAVVGANARQVQIDQLGRGDLPFLHRALQLQDRGLGDLELGGGRGHRPGARGRSEEEDDGRTIEHEG